MGTKIQRDGQSGGQMLCFRGTIRLAHLCPSVTWQRFMTARGLESLTAALCPRVQAFADFAKLQV